MTVANTRYALPFQVATEADHARMGGKCASLAALITAKAPVPPGFAVTTDAYLVMLAQDGLGDTLAKLLGQLDGSIANQADIAGRIKDAFAQQPIPTAIADAIRQQYAALGDGADLPVAVRSSGTAEDMPDASFAGQGDTFLWCVGVDAVLDKVKACWASLFNARAIAYRIEKGIGHLDTQMAVAVQRMVDAQAAGVAMTLDPSTGDRSAIVVESSWGLGELVVSGELTPDHFVLDKVMLSPLRQTIAAKAQELVADPAAGKTVLREVEQPRQAEPSITAEQLVEVARLAKSMERHFRCPQDIEWAIDRHRTDGNGVVLLQSRPETVWSRKPAAMKPASFAVGVEGILGRLIAPVKDAET